MLQLQMLQAADTSVCGAVLSARQQQQQQQQMGAICLLLLLALLLLTDELVHVDVRVLRFCWRLLSAQRLASYLASLSLLQARQLLVTVGLEEPGISTATLKVWEAERVTTAAATAAAASSAAAAISSLPQPAAASAAAASLPPLRVHKLFSSKHPESEVTALAVTDSGSVTGSSLLIAVGLAAGAVHVYSGEVSSQKGKLQHTGKLQVRPDSGELWKVNALAFAAPQQQARDGPSNKEPAAAAAPGGGSKIAALGRSTAATSSSNAGDGSSSDQQAAASQQWLYVVTEAQTLAFSMADMSKTILDQQGLLASGCSVLQEGLLVVARDDALYEYTPETRAGCTAFEGMGGWLIVQAIGLL
jgi:hypothetical protein